MFVLPMLLKHTKSSNEFLHTPSKDVDLQLWHWTFISSSSRCRVRMKQSQVKVVSSLAACCSLTKKYFEKLKSLSERANVSLQHCNLSFLAIFCCWGTGTDPRTCTFKKRVANFLSATVERERENDFFQMNRSQEGDKLESQTFFHSIALGPKKIPTLQHFEIFAPVLR